MMTRPRKSTLIRNARKATAARKRAAFEFQTPNKKPGARPGLYTFDATRTPASVLVRTIHTPHYGA